LQEYLSALLEKGLIEQYQKELQEEGKVNKEKQRPSNYYYRITDNGRWFFLLQARF